MKKLNSIESTGIPLPLENIDTDQIIPARFLKATDKAGFGDNLFRDWRFDKQGKPLDFVLNDPKYKGEILVTGRNFGCGSSREHAAWALAGYGFRVVISSFFADIFQNNALNNGILPILIKEEELQALLQSIMTNPETRLQVHLENQTLKYQQQTLQFPINAYKKQCLLNGYDDIDYLLAMREEIEQYEQRRTI